MDPCPFVRILVGNLTLKFPVATRPIFSGIHPTTSPCYCKIKLKNFPSQVCTIPLLPQEDGHVSHVPSLGACFNLNKSDMEKLTEQTLFSKKPCLKISIYRGRRGTSCGLKSGNLLGSVSVPLDLKGVMESRACVFHNGWVSVGEGGKGSSSAQLHLNVRGEVDPRFVFRFDGEPECSPQVFQIQGNIRQPVFTCKFSLRNLSDRNLRSRSSLSESSSSRSWLSSLGSDREQPMKERKGWSITVHDLSGSPVALASMVTPFVPSPGSDRVSRSNPGAWLILRPGDGTWKPWGRLEAWLERGPTDGLGHRFELLPDATSGGGIAADGITLTNSTLSTKKGGKFTIDINNSNSPMTSPCSNGDLGSGSGSGFGFGGFVMSSTVEGVGRCSKPEVEVGVQHVTCTEDAAVFVALAAAMDLSMDACRLFSQKLRKELRQQSQDSVV